MSVSIDGSNRPVRKSTRLANSSSNSIATPALLPDGSIAEASVSSTLTERGAQLDSAALKQITADAFAKAERVGAEEDEEL